MDTQFKFLEITIDGSYAIATWGLDYLTGDAIFLNEEGKWQLISISADRLEYEDFNRADIPLEVAQRLLRQHHQKLGY